KRRQRTTALDPARRGEPMAAANPEAEAAGMQIALTAFLLPANHMAEALLPDKPTGPEGSRKAADSGRSAILKTRKPDPTAAANGHRSRMPAAPRKPQQVKRNSSAWKAPKTTAGQAKIAEDPAMAASRTVLKARTAIRKHRSVQALINFVLCNQPPICCWQR